MRLPAVVLAGGKNSKELAAATGQTQRALIALAGKTMLEYTVYALVRSDSVGKIIVVGDVLPDPIYTLASPKHTLVDNLFSGLEEAGTTGNVLVVTSDIPFITPEAIDDFVAQSVRTGAGFCYPIIPMDDYNKRFPGLKRTTLRIKEGTFTGGNAVLVQAAALQSRQELISEAYAARKSVFKLGAMLGMPLLTRILLSQTIAPNLLSVAQLEQGVTRLLGVPSRAVITRHPELGTDVDKPEDVTAAEEILKRQSPE